MESREAKILLATTNKPWEKHSTSTEGRKRKTAIERQYPLDGRKKKQRKNKLNDTTETDAEVSLRTHLTKVPMLKQMSKTMDSIVKQI